VVKLQVSERPLEQLSFLLGDWRGTGVLDYPGQTVKRSHYEIRAMCKTSPDKAQILLITFNDDPKDDTMFHASQGFIFVERRTGELRINRHWLMDSENEGFVTVERLTPAGDGKSLGFTVVERDGVPEDFRHDGTIEQVNESELVVKGVVKVGGREYLYVDRYTRRAKPNSESTTGP
jgi:hypothetical protein